MNEYEKALTFQLKGIDIQEEILDSKHPLLATSYLNLAYTYKHLKQYQKSLEFQQKAIQIIEKTIDFKASDLAIYYHNIAATHNHLKQHKKALEYNNKAINILEKTLDSKHPSLAVSYNSIVATYKALNQYEKAQEYQQKSIRILKEALSENHPNQMAILNRLLEIYYNRGLDAFSRKNYESALRDFEKIITYADISEIWNYKGLCHYYSFDYPNAITAYQKAAALLPEIKQRHFYNNIGTAYVKNKQYQEAKTAFQEYEKLYSTEGRTFRNWAMYYALQNDKEKALSNLKKAIKLGYDDIEWLQTDNSMDNLRKEKTFAKIIKQLKKKAKKSNDIKK